MLGSSSFSANSNVGCRSTLRPARRIPTCVPARHATVSLHYWPLPITLLTAADGRGGFRRRSAGLVRHRLGARSDFALVDLGLGHRAAPGATILSARLRHAVQIVLVGVNLRAAGIPGA